MQTCSLTPINDYIIRFFFILASGVCFFHNWCTCTWVHVSVCVLQLLKCVHRVHVRVNFSHWPCLSLCYFPWPKLFFSSWGAMLGWVRKQNQCKMLVCAMIIITFCVDVHERMSDFIQWIKVKYWTAFSPQTNTTDICSQLETYLNLNSIVHWSTLSDEQRRPFYFPYFFDNLSPHFHLDQLENQEQNHS